MVLSRLSAEFRSFQMEHTPHCGNMSIPICEFHVFHFFSKRSDMAQRLPFLKGYLGVGHADEIQEVFYKSRATYFN